MENSRPNLPEPESRPEPEPEPQPESNPLPEEPSSPYINEHIKRAYEHLKLFIQNASNYYQRSPRLQKVTHQGRYLPAFWTVACIFSLVVNVILIALLISIGHNLFAFKAKVSQGLLEASNSLAIMDKAHIVTTVPAQTTVLVKDNLPVVFDLPINQNTQLSLANDTKITGATIYLNNAAVTTDLMLPTDTLIQAEFNMSVPVSTTIPMNINVPVTVQVPIDIAIDQTDLHQSIVGLEGSITPYKTVTGSLYNSPSDIPLCNNWWSGWLCGILFGKQ